MSASGSDGRRALYSVPAASPADDEDESEQHPERAPGKEALYSAAGRRPGTVVLECSSCGACTRVSWLDLARRHLPVPVWIPGRRFSRRLPCPACERRTWVGVRWLA